MHLLNRTAAPFLDSDDEAWVIETLAFLNRQIPPPGQLLSRQTIRPTPAFFPATDFTGHARAVHIFDAVRHHMDMLDWACELIAQPPRAGASVPGIPFHGPVRHEGPAGTFGMSGNAAMITYDPADIADPMRLIAVFAHELAHYRLADLSEPPPGARISPNLQRT